MQEEGGAPTSKAPAKTRGELNPYTDNKIKGREYLENGWSQCPKTAVAGSNPTHCLDVSYFSSQVEAPRYAASLLNISTGCLKH